MESQFSPRVRAQETCAVCGDDVTPRRCVRLSYPTMVLCIPCHSDNIDRLDSLSKENEHDDELAQAV